MPRPQQQDAALSRDALGLPHPAEDLSEDDDLLSWILVDQLGVLPQDRLGVHPQQVKFVGPPFKTDDVLTIVKETVIKGSLASALERLQEFHLIKDHIESKQTASQKERVIKHLRRYLSIYQPTSRIEIFSTPRYTHVTGHPELAVFATAPLAKNMVLTELLGGVVPLPDEWRQEMEIGENYDAVEVEGEESDDEEDDEDPDVEDDSVSSVSGARRPKGKEPRGQRRSDRIKRRDFSIVWSTSKRRYELFLGPARFLNHDCNPNVTLFRHGRDITFKTLRPIKIGEELTTFYGENYFGRDNIECLCLSCEQSGVGAWSHKPAEAKDVASRGGSRAPSMDSALQSHLLTTVLTLNGSGSHGHSSTPQSTRRTDLSAYADDSEDDAASNAMGTAVSTPPRKQVRTLLSGCDSPAAESVVSEIDSVDEGPSRRARLMRVARTKSKPLFFGKRHLNKQLADDENDSLADQISDDFPEDFPRCITCATPLTEQIWFLGRYFDHCKRCIRHSLIFLLPWPAHRPQDVQEYPPPHLVPSGYFPRKVTSVVLPSLSKPPRKRILDDHTETDEAETTALPDYTALPSSKEDRRAIRFRQDIEDEAYIVEQLRVSAWQSQHTKELARIAQAEAKEAAKLARAEAKRKRNEGKIRGTGVWSRYEIVTQAEMERREAERTQVVSGTRSGRRIRQPDQDDAEVQRLAEQKLREQRERERRADEKAREYRRQDKLRRMAMKNGAALHGGSRGNGTTLSAPESSSTAAARAAAASVSNHKAVAIQKQRTTASTPPLLATPPQLTKMVVRIVPRYKHIEIASDTDGDSPDVIDLTLDSSDDEPGPPRRPHFSPHRGSLTKPSAPTKHTGPPKGGSTTVTSSRPALRPSLAPRPPGPAPVPARASSTLVPRSRDPLLSRPSPSSPTRSQHDDRNMPPVKKRGRPPGTGHRQKRARLAKAREERAAAASRSGTGGSDEGAAVSHSVQAVNENNPGVAMGPRPPPTTTSSEARLASESIASVGSGTEPSSGGVASVEEASPPWANDTEECKGDATYASVARRKLDTNHTVRPQAAMNGPIRVTMPFGANAVKRKRESDGSGHSNSTLSSPNVNVRGFESLSRPNEDTTDRSVLAKTIPSVVRPPNRCGIEADSPLQTATVKRKVRSFFKSKTKFITPKDAVVEDTNVKPRTFFLP